MRKHAMYPLENRLLYGILDTGYVAEPQIESTARSMIAGGVQILQLRAKNTDAPTILRICARIAPLARAAGVPFILNDHPELVEAAHADGAHVGQEDMPVAEARQLAGPGAIIGKSTHSLAQATAAFAEKPDYIGFGPLFATPTKPDYPAIGLEAIRDVESLATCPVFCIGGIKRDNLPQVLAAGARRVVIVSGILTAPDPQAYAADCLRLLR